MKLLHLIFFLVFVSTTAHSQSPQRIKFQHDDSGNQVRRWVCVNCSAKTVLDSINVKGNAVTDAEVLPGLNETQSKITYYPNPVKEELHVQWDNDNNSFVSEIEIYSLSGQKVGKISNLKQTDHSDVPFRHYPQGYYNLILIYNNGENKTLKIIKE